MTQRKIVQITVSGPDNVLYALCDDGSVWELGNTKWHKMPSIPQDDEVQS